MPLKKKSQSSSIRQHFYREWQDREIGTEFKKEKNVVYQLFPGLKHIIPVKTKEQLIRVVFTSYLTYQYQTSALTNERQITKRELKWSNMTQLEWWRGERGEGHDSLLEYSAAESHVVWPLHQVARWPAFTRRCSETRANGWTRKRRIEEMAEGPSRHVTLLSPKPHIERSVFLSVLTPINKDRDDDYHYCIFWHLTKPAIHQVLPACSSNEQHVVGEVETGDKRFTWFFSTVNC